MKNKIEKFYKDVEYYLDLFDERCDKGDYPEGFAALYYAEKVADVDDLSDIYLAYAQGYAEIDRMASSDEYYFKTLKSGRNLSDSLFGLIQNMIIENRFEEAEYYARLLANLEEDIDERYIFDMLDLPEGDFREDKYRVVYSKGDSESEAASECIRQGHFDEAIEILEKVSRNDKGYVRAQNDLTTCYSIKQDFNAALRCAKNALLADENDIVALCNNIMLLNMSKKRASADKLIEKLLSIEDFTVFEASKIATTMCECCRHTEVVKYLGIVMEEKPYVDLYMLFLGIAYYNLGNFQAAKKEFDKLIKLDGKNSVAKYYMRLVNKKEEEAKKGKTPEALPYSPQLPYSEVLKAYKTLDKMLRYGDFEALTLNGKEKEAFDFVMQGGDLSAIVNIAAELAASDLPQKTDFLDEVLFDSTLPRGAKLKILQNLILTGEKTLYFVHNFRFEKVAVKVPTDFDGYPEVIRAGYALAHALFSFIDEGLIAKLPLAAKEFLIRYKERNCNFRSPEGVAIVFVDMIDKKNPLYELYTALGVKKELVKKYIAALFE